MQSPLPRCDVHGVYVIHTKLEDHLGRIAYVNDDGLVWVNWQPWRSKKNHSASGCNPEDLKVIPATPKPWFNPRPYMAVWFPNRPPYEGNVMVFEAVVLSDWLQQGDLPHAIYELTQKGPVWPK